MEYIDIVDKDGRPTGEIKSREEVHKEGLLHRHIHVWIINSSGEILLQKRAVNKKTYPNLWSQSAEGHVSAGKTLTETVAAEVKEELNITIDNKNLEAAFSYYRGPKEFQNGWIENAINYVYIIENDTPIEKIKIQKSEVADVKWMNWREYKNKIESNNLAYRQYPEEYQRFIFNALL